MTIFHLQFNMGRLDCVLAFLILCFASCHAQDSYCESYWTFFQGSCYGFGRDSVTWGDAEEICRVYDAKLAEIETVPENDFIKNMSKSSGHNVWLGATDIFSEGKWKWVSSKLPLEFTDWIPGEPNHFGNADGEDCLQLRSGSGYAWNDASCAAKAYFICEAEPLGAIIG